MDGTTRKRPGGTAIGALWTAVVGAWLVMACAGNPLSSPPGEQISGLDIAVSTPVIADIVSHVAGPGADVWSVVPGDGDPHTYDATAAQMVRLHDADLYVLLGAHLEAFEESGAWRRAVIEAGMPVLRLADHLDLIVRDIVIDHGDHVHDLRDGDPHVWLDPAYVRTMARVVADRLMELDPGHASTFVDALAVYDIELATLEVEMEAALSAIPDERRRIIVTHDAFAYLERRFGVEVVGTVVHSPGQDPNAGDIAGLVDLVRAGGAAAAFHEPQFPSDVLQMLASETGLPVGTLLTDSFGGRVSDYVGLMRYDLASLVDTLAR